MSEQRVSRVEQKAMINDVLITFDFMEGDIVRDKGTEPKGIITKVDNPFVYIDWIDEDVKKCRGTRWMVSGVEYAN